MDEWVWTVMFSTIGLAIGLLLMVILRQALHLKDNNSSPLTIIGWAFAFLIGFLTRENLFYTLEQFTENYRVIYLIVLPVETGIAGLIGSLITTDQLRTSPNIHIKWKTVLAAALGFGLGNLLINILFAPFDEELVFKLIQLAIWGFLGGAALAFPSKSYRRYLLFGLLGSLGMALGHLIWMALGASDGIRPIILGATLGLFLGIGTKKPSGALILLLMGTVAYTFRYSINDFYYSSDLSMAPIVEYPILALNAGLTGMILGTAWSFLIGDNATLPAKQDTD